MKFNSALTLTASLFFLLSCTQAKQKTKEVISSAKSEAVETINNGREHIVNRVFPPFDSDQADTENNIQRFKDFLKVELSQDIRNIYCYDDVVGIDAKYLFTFQCSPSTSHRIIETHQLVPDSSNSRNGLFEVDLPWWDKNTISQLPKYTWTDGQQYYKHFWYDEANQQGYFIDYDL